MGSDFTKTISLYMKFEVLKLVGALWLFYLIFLKLDIENYANYGIAQSIIMLSSLLLSFNVKSSFQKLYSKKCSVNSANLVILIILFSGSLFFTIFYWVVSWSGLGSWIFSNPDYAPNLGLLYTYCLIFGVSGVISSLLNARRQTFSYGLSTTLPFFISIPSLIFVEEVNIDILLFILIVSNSVMLTLIFIRNVRVLAIKNYSTKHSLIIFRYVFSYTWLSIPTLSSKYLFDVVGRSLLLSSKGELGVAILTFSTSLFSIFRSVEQGFFKAITPFLLLNDKAKHKKLLIAKKLIFIQSVFTLVFFALSPYWIEILKLIFSSKPESVFSPIILLVMACTTVISYNKNYFLSKAKKHAASIKRFYIIATIINVSMLIAISIVDLSVIYFVLIQLVFSAVNLLLVRFVVKP